MSFVTDEGLKAGRGRALITGASAGIGREFARAFAARGYDVILLARDREALFSLAREIVATYGVEASVMPADLATPEVANAIFERLHTQGTAVEILVNNAGVITGGDFVEIAWEEQLRLLQINIVALTAMTRLFLPAMVRRRGGRILNVASIGAFAPVPRLATYAASKAYVLSFTEALAEELRGSALPRRRYVPVSPTRRCCAAPGSARLPDALVMSPAQVAAKGCAACLAGEALAIPGLANVALTSGSRLLPRSMVRSISGAINIGEWSRLLRAVLARGHSSAHPERKSARMTQARVTV